MLIKGVVSKDSRTARKGDPIPVSAEDALDTAILYGIRRDHNDITKTYWVRAGSVVATEFRKSMVDKKSGSWTATAKGTVMIGHHLHEDDHSYAARPHGFEVSYKSGEDEYGVPDIEIISFSLTAGTAATTVVNRGRYDQAKPTEPPVVAPLAPAPAVAAETATEPAKPRRRQ